jgi:hypothetical protein
MVTTRLRGSEPGIPPRRSRKIDAHCEPGYCADCQTRNEHGKVKAGREICRYFTRQRRECDAENKCDHRKPLVETKTPDNGSLGLATVRLLHKTRNAAQ